MGRHKLYTDEERAARAKVSSANSRLKHRDTRQKRNLKSFGLTLEEYNQMVKTQENKCAICGNPEKRSHRHGAIRRLAVDHCHKTGRVRKLLCADCNVGLGNFHDSMTVLEKAIQYLKES